MQPEVIGSGESKGLEQLRQSCVLTRRSGARTTEFLPIDIHEVVQVESLGDSTFRNVILPFEESLKLSTSLIGNGTRLAVGERISFVEKDAKMRVRVECAENEEDEEFEAEQEWRALEDVLAYEESENEIAALDQEFEEEKKERKEDLAITQTEHEEEKIESKIEV